MERKVILTRGIQGSGKSTWAKNWAKEDPTNRIRINNDDIRNMFGEYWVPNRESEVTYIVDSMFNRAMSRGYDIVIDNMNLNPKEIKVYERWIEDHNCFDFNFKYKLEFKNFNTPLDICIIRDSAREIPIGRDIITETYNKYKDIIDGFSKTEEWKLLIKLYNSSNSYSHGGL